MSRTARTGSLGELLPIAAVEPDGLLITTEGRYVRVIECQRVPNTITADHSRLQILERAFRELCRAIPDRQSLVIYAQTDPIPIDEAFAEDRARVQAACEQDMSAGRGELAATRRRFLAGLKQTVISAAGAEQPAVAARWWVAVPYQPAGPETPREQFRHAANRARGRTAFAAHHRAAVASLQLTGQIQAALAGAGIETYLLDGVQTLALLWERVHPAATELPDLDRLADTVDGRGSEHPTGCVRAASSRVARAVRRRCRGDRRGREPRVPAPSRRDARGDRASRHAAAADESVVARAPAVLPAARDGRGAHHRRAPRPRARPPAPALETAARRDPVQAAARSTGRLRRGRSTRRGAGRRRRARRQRSARASTRSGSTARSATPAASNANSNGSSATPPASFTRSRTRA